MSTDSKNFCPHCGDLVSIDDVFCPNCGGSIKEKIKIIPKEGYPIESTLSNEKLLQIDELVKERDIAKVQWIVTATNLTIEEISSACKDLGFRIEGDFIFSPEIQKTKVQKAVFTPPIKQITYGKTRQRFYGKPNH